MPSQALALPPNGIHFMLLIHLQYFPSANFNSFDFGRIDEIHSVAEFTGTTVENLSVGNSNDLRVEITEIGVWIIVVLGVLKLSKEKNKFTYFYIIGNAD